MVASNGNDSRFSWLWIVDRVHNEPGEQVPISVGDRLFVCVEEDGKAHFLHQNQKNEKDENSKLWDAARAAIDPKTGELQGSLPGTRTFQMEIKETDCGRQIRAKHQRNPDEGNWDGSQPGGTS